MLATLYQLDPVFCNQLSLVAVLLVFVLKVLDGGKIVLESGMLCAVVVYCFVFSCAYVEVPRGLTEGL